MQPFGLARYRPAFLAGTQWQPAPDGDGMWKDAPVRRGRFLDAEVTGGLTVSGTFISGVEGGEDTWIEIDGSDAARISFFTRLTTAGGEPVSADIWMNDTGSDPILKFQAASAGASEKAFIDMKSAELDIGTGVGTRLRFGNDGTNDRLTLEGFTNDPPLRFGDGTESLPVISWVDDNDTGFYRVSAISGTTGYSSNGVTTLQLTNRGLFTDHSGNALPKDYYEALGSHTFSGTGAYEVVGSTWSVSFGTSRAISLVASCVAQFTKTTSGTSDGRCRIGVSYDGGSTWTYGYAERGTLGASTGGVTRMPIAAKASKINTTPSGNVQVRVEVYQSVATISITNVALEIHVKGDI